MNNAMGVNVKVIAISLISALMLSYVLGLWLFHRNIQHGPDSNDIKRDVYYDENIGCYKMAPIVHICSFGRQRI